MKLTAGAIATAEPRAGNYILRDDAVSGFGVVVTPNGVKSYVVEYRVGGRRRRMTIARAEALTVELARKAARRVLAQAALGTDPLHERSEVRRRAEADISMTLLCQRYLDDYATAQVGRGEQARKRKKPSSIRNDRQMIDKYIGPALGRKKVVDVTRADIERLHRSMAATPYSANRTLALLRRIFNLAEAWGLRSEHTNPTRFVEAYREEKRQRYLTSEELGRLEVAIEEALAAKDSSEGISPAAALFVRLCLVTGMRSGELLSLRWDQVDLDRGVIHLADSKTGAREVVLSSVGVRLLSEAYREVDNPYVLPGRHKNRDGEPTHLSNPAKPWGILRKAADIEDVRLHDLRHTHASIGVGAGLSLPLVGRLLGHTQPATTARYAHVDVDPARVGADLIGEAISAAMEAGRSKAKVEAEKVVDLDSRRSASDSNH